MIDEYVSTHHPLRELVLRHEAFMLIHYLHEPIACYRTKEYADAIRAQIRALDDGEIVALYYGFFSTDWDPYAQQWVRGVTRGRPHHLARMREAFAVRYHLLKEYVHNMKRDWPGVYDDAVFQYRPVIEEHVARETKRLVPPIPAALLLDCPPN